MFSPYFDFYFTLMVPPRQSNGKILSKQLKESPETYIIEEEIKEEYASQSVILPYKEVFT